MSRLVLGFLLTGAMLFPVSSSNAEPYIDRSAECLALNMYYEARNQGTAGVLAVTAVVFNRVNDKRFPNTICGVIEQGPTRESWKTKKTLDKNDAVFYPIKNRCQFSWYCDGKSDKPKDITAWRWSQRIAELVITGGIEDVTEGATHYHAYYVKPRWVKQKVFIKQIGSHLYYKGKKNGK